MQTAPGVEPKGSAKEPERRYRPDQTREKILAAAKLLFRTKGYLRTSTSDLAAEAGVAEGSIFYHYGTKRNLLAVLGSDYAQELVAAMRGSAQDLAELEPGLMIERTFDFVCRKGRLKETVGLARNDPEIQPYMSASRTVVVDFLARVMEARQAAHADRTMHIPVGASLLYAAVCDALDHVMREDLEIESEVVKQECIRFVRAATSARADV